MRLPPAAAAALVLLPLLAGCLGGPPAPAPGGEDPRSGQGGSPSPAPGGGPQPPRAPTAPAPRPPAPRRVSFGGPSNEVSIAIDPTNATRVAIGAKDYSLFFAPPCPAQNVWAGVYFTTDNGRLWRHTVLPGFPRDTRASVLQGYRCASDPLVAYDGQGVLHYAGLAFGFANDTGPLPQPPAVPLPAPPVPVPPVQPPAPPNATPPVAPPQPTLLFVARSRDGGLTWNETAIVAEDKAGAVRHDRPAFAVDAATGALHLAWTVASGVGAPNASAPADVLVTSRSVDGGATWTSAAPVATAAPVVRAGGAALAARDGRVVLAFLGQDAQGASVMLAAASADGGETWGPAQSVAAVTPPPSPLENARFRVPTAPSLALDPASGRAMVAWNDAAAGTSDVVVAFSDDGAAWSAPRAVHGDASNDQFFPAAAFRGDGEALLLFYDRRGDPANKLVQVALARSADGGETWNETRLNQPAFDGDRSLHQDGSPFLGDYIGLAAAGQVAWAAWTATPTGRGDVYVMRV